jgi:PPOX class probable F420-dependent enzyme
MARISEGFVRLMKEPSFCQLATLRRDGSPAINEVWVDTDGEHILINTPVKSRKVANMRRDPRVAVNVVDPSNQWRLGVARGRVVDIKTDGAEAHIDELSRKYRGEDYRFHNPESPRSIVTIEPDWVREIGLDGQQRS